MCNPMHITAMSLDTALDTTLLVGVDGRKRWRHVSKTLPDLQNR